MKKTLVFLFVFATIFSLLSVPAFAYTENDGAGNLTETGKDPDTEISADGDYTNITGGFAEISGSVGGDVLGMFSQFTATDLEVGGSVRLLAISVNLEKLSCRNITFACGEAVIGKDVQANAVMIFAMDTVVFSGSCETLIVNAPEVRIEGEVKSIAKIYADNVIVDQNAVIKEAVIESSGKPTLADGKTSALEQFGKVISWKQVNVAKQLLSNMASAIIYAVAGALLIQFIFGKSTSVSAELFKCHPIRYILSGFFLLLSIPGLAVFMIALSKEIAIALLLVYLAVMQVARLFAGCILASRFLPNMNRFLASVLVTTTVSALSVLPVVGGVVTVVSTLITFGYFGIIVFSGRRRAQTVNPE